MKHAISVIAISAAAFGCTSIGEDVSPVSSDAGTTTTTATETGSGGTGGEGGAPPDAGPPIRTVMQRNPYGNVAETENLLWDGDFEWASPFSDQYGWLSGSASSYLGYDFPNVKIGAVCRSGMKCVQMSKNRVIAGIGVASAGGKIQASFWAKVTTGDCTGVSGAIIAYDGEGDPDVTVDPVSEKPDASGWCHYETVVDERKGKPLLYIENESGGTIVVDDAVVKKVATGTPLKAQHGPPRAALVSKLDDARDSMHRLRGPHDPPPNRARRAFEARKGMKR